MARDEWPVRAIAEIRAGRARRSPPPADTQALEDVTDPLPRAQGRAAEPAARRRRAPARGARGHRRRPTGPARRSRRRSRPAAAELAAASSSARLASRPVDVTLPAIRCRAIGRLHLMTQTRREIEDVFLGLGFNVAEGPEVETVYYNFDALNHLADAPRRLQTDTFYVEPADRHLRSRRAQGAHLAGPGPGDGAPAAADLRHRPGPCLPPRLRRNPHAPVPPDRGARGRRRLTLADLKGTLLTFARAIFGDEREVRLRPHFFPFTEPSVEVDVSCFDCTDGVAPAGSALPLCKGSGWIEILGAGMVDPNVFEHVRRVGYDPEQSRGFAFGMGIERIAMLSTAMPDLRLFYDNDIRFLEQFGRCGSRSRWRPVHPASTAGPLDPARVRRRG